MLKEITIGHVQNLNYIINLRELCPFSGVIKYVYHNLISDIYKGICKKGGEKTMIITYATLINKNNLDKICDEYLALCNIIVNVPFSYSHLSCPPGMYLLRCEICAYFLLIFCKKKGIARPASSYLQNISRWTI